MSSFPYLLFDSPRLCRGKNDMKNPQYIGQAINCGKLKSIGRTTGFSDLFRNARCGSIQPKKVFGGTKQSLHCSLDSAAPTFG